MQGAKRVLNNAAEDSSCMEIAVNPVTIVEGAHMDRIERTSYLRTIGARLQASSKRLTQVVLCEQRDGVLDPVGLRMRC
eukprot:2264265-Amphidinium_carterae.1